MSVSWLYGTHNRAGEVTFSRISGYTYHVKVVTYTVASSAADRDFISVVWGDGELDTLNRSNGPVGMNGYQQGVEIDVDVKMNTYEGVHTYPGPGEYWIGFEDANRNEGVINIPGSVDVPFYVQSMVIIDPFQGANSSPELLNVPLDEACVGEVFIHNPGAWDVDGDSLAYKLITCSGQNGNDIPGYIFPPNVTVNEYTGDLIWDAPQLIGEYNFAMKIEEWRNGQLIGCVVRDLQVAVLDCNNSPPIINAPDEICVEAGDTVEFTVTASDPDLGTFINLSSVGGVYELGDQSAQFQEEIGFLTVSSDFTWVTSCDLVRNQAYQVLFKAEDDGSPVSLTSMKTTNITVVAPAPENVQASPVGNSINISWSPDYCSNATGYKIYRGSYYGYIPGVCELGVPDYTGYELIGSTNAYLDTTYTDNGGLGHGVQYCYMIVACFADGAESYASEEVCTELIKDMPIITNVSVLETSNNEGKMYVAWSKPTEIDTVSAPGPYRYDLYRSYPGEPASLVYSTSDLNDTLFLDSLLNTGDSEIVYYIEFLNETPGNEFSIGESQSAHSIFVSSAASNQSVLLAWNDETPWTNSYYRVYKENQGAFELIDSTNQQNYLVDSLNNLEEYCFRIESVGAYSTTDLISPILNFSQEICDTPFDSIPPCSPELTVDHNCEEYYNFISWGHDTLDCNSDLQHYNLYYKESLVDSFEFVQTYYPGDLLEYNDQDFISVAGCYYVTAVDTFGNESLIDETYCFDNCPEYELPNVFTPNADGVNDWFIPFPYRYVDHVDLKIYNRWGELVFEHNGSPDIKWDGFSIKTNKLVTDGVYYYVCNVYEIRLEGLVVRTIPGFVHVIQGDPENQNVGN